MPGGTEATAAKKPRRLLPSDLCTLCPRVPGMGFFFGIGSEVCDALEAACPVDHQILVPPYNGSLVCRPEPSPSKSIHVPSLYASTGVYMSPPMIACALGGKPQAFSPLLPAAIPTR